MTLHNVTSKNIMNNCKCNIIHFTYFIRPLKTCRNIEGSVSVTRPKLKQFRKYS